ncbi:MAG: GAF domain-containing protein [Chloroflexi bacterium]|nr:MAG: GAF domain-containing protein [Chloroflexota bacterium]
MSGYWLLLIVITLLGLGWWLRRRSMIIRRPFDESQQILNNLQDAVLVADLQGRILFANVVAQAWLDVRPSGGDLHDLTSLITPQDTFLSLLETGGEEHLQVGGRAMWVLCQRVPLNGSPVISLILRDVTTTEALLAEERRRAHEFSILNQIAQAINASLDLDTVLKAILDNLRTLGDYRAARVCLWDEASNRLIVRREVNDGIFSGEADGDRWAGQVYSDWIVQHRTPLLIPDTSQPSDLQPPTGEAARFIRSYVGVPLLSGERFIGTLEMVSDGPEVFTQETLSTLQVVASMAGVAIENAQLYAEAMMRADELAILNTLAAVASSSLDPDEILQVVVYSLVQALNCQKAAIFLLDEERRELSLHTSWGLSEEFVAQSQHIPIEPQGRGQVILDRYPLIVPDIRREPSLAYLLPLAEQEGFVAFADAPMRGRERVLGALTVYYDQPHPFPPAEVELLTTFANQVAIALENALLYDLTDQALTRRVEQLSAIEEIGRELTSTLDLERIFNLLLQRAMGTTGATAGLLALYEEKEQGLRLIAHQGYSEEVLASYRDDLWPLTHGIIGRVIRMGEPALISNVREDPNHGSRRPDTVAQIAVPIVKEKRVLGVVCLESNRSQGFSKDDLHFVSHLAEMAAIAIENARLFQQVREGRDNLQAIVDSIHEGILVFDREGRIVLVNPTIEALSGIPSEQLLGHTIEEVVAQHGPRILEMLGYAPEELDGFSAQLQSRSEEVEKRSFELAGPIPREIERTATPVRNRQGEVIGRIMLLRDVTEERHLARMRQDLTNMIIHDIRSPLTAVVGGIELASDVLQDGGEYEVALSALAMATESSNQILHLVNSLLDISRLEAGQMPLHRAPCSVADLVQTALEQMWPLAEKNEIALRTEVPPDLPPAYADQELIHRVLVNLMDNAIKYSNPEGQVTLSAELVTDQRGGALICLSVADTGPGIPPEYREKIFERFIQVGGRRRGAGLGLTFCRLVVEAHGGRIWVEPALPKGSIFRFTLPIADSS